MSDKVGRKTEISARAIKRIENLSKDRNVLNLYRPKNTTKYKKNKSCVICGESRSIDLCHIIPVSVSSFLDNYKHFGKDEKNFIILCKNHHYCFDKGLLNQEELNKIYLEKKDFFDDVILDFANSNISINKENISVSRHDIKTLNQFNKWIKWLADNIFIKYGSK